MMPKITWNDKNCEHYWVIEFDHLQGVFESARGGYIRFESPMELLNFIMQKQREVESHANASVIVRIYNQNGKLDDTKDYPAEMNYHVNGKMFQCRYWENGAQSENEDGAHFMSFDRNTGYLVSAKDRVGTSWISNRILEYNTKMDLAAAEIPEDVTVKYDHS